MIDQSVHLIACPLIYKHILWEAAKHHKGTLLDVDRDYYRFVERDDLSELSPTGATDLYVSSDFA